MALSTIGGRPEIVLPISTASVSEPDQATGRARYEADPAALESGSLTLAVRMLVIRRHIAAAIP